MDIYTTQAFYIPISKDDFGKEFKPDDEVEFIISIDGMADLPKWINYRHQNSSGKAFLYGTPSLNDDMDINIEIIAMNKFNYDTFRDTMKFVIKRKESMHHLSLIQK